MCIGDDWVFYAASKQQIMKEVKIEEGYRSNSIPGCSHISTCHVGFVSRHFLTLPANIIIIIMMMMMMMI